MKNTQSQIAIAYAQAFAILSFVYATIRTASYNRGLTDTSYNFHIFDSVLYSFTVPLLFFIAGASYITLKEKYKKEDFLYFIVDKLIYCFLLWSVLQGIIEVIFSGYTNTSAFIVDIYYNITAEPDSHFKLLIALIINYSAALILFRRKSTWVLPLALAISAGLYLIQDLFSDLYPFKYIAHYFVFFLLGYAFTLYSKKITPYLSTILYISAPAFILYQYTTHISLHKDTYEPGLLTLPLAVIGIAFIVSLCFKIKTVNIKILITLSQATFVIFLTHAIFGNGIREILLNSFSIKSTKIHLVVDYATAIIFSLLCYKITKNNILRYLFVAPEIFSAQHIFPYFVNKIKQRSILFLLPIVCVSFFLICLFVIHLWSNAIIHQKNSIATTKHFELSANASDIEEGRRLAKVFGCYFGCHGINMEGHIFSKEPLIGVFASPNLTKSIRKYTTEELDGIIRHGIRPNGTPLIGRMPSVSFNAITDDQLFKILSFINSTPKQQSSPMHSSFGAKTELEIIQGKILTQPEKIDLAREFYPTQTDPQLKRGQALVRAACSECHNYTLKGFEEIHSPPLFVARAYQFEQFKTLLQTGVKINGEQAGLMKVAALNRFSNLNDQELIDIYAYLQTLTP